jgi:hypothetical protein
MELVDLVGSALSCGKVKRKIESRRGNQTRSGERPIQRRSESVTAGTERRKNLVWLLSLALYASQLQPLLTTYFDTMIPYAMTENLPSVEVVGAYKDYPVKVIQTGLEDQQIVYAMLKDAKTLIDLMDEHGFTPPTLRPTPEVKELKEADASFCSLHDIKMKERTNKGGAKFFSHGKKLPDGSFSWCSGRGFPNEK